MSTSTIGKGLAHYFDSLNLRQLEAVEHEGGPLLVFAGAGSGKTRVLTLRIAHLVMERSVESSSILAITFTNKAAREMQDRLELLLPGEFKGLTMGTFHSICAGILRKEIHVLGYNSSFAIYDEGDSDKLVKECMVELDMDVRGKKARTVRYLINKAKSDMVSPEDYRDTVFDELTESTSAVYGLYEMKLADRNALDFDDLLLRVHEILSSYPLILQKYQTRFLHILVDEYQDTNLVQYRLLRMIAGKHRNIFVVGDDDQSIYTWRGADLRNIHEFKSDFPEATVIKLEQNYRSTQNILNAAWSVVKNNSARTDKSLWTPNPAGEAVKLYSARDEKDESRKVSDEIRLLFCEEAFGYPDIAVFYRTHAQSRAIEDAFVASGIPYRIHGGLKYYGRREIKDIVSYLKLIDNRKDDTSLARVINVPARGIGSSTIDRLRSHARRHSVPLFDALEDAEDVQGIGTATADTLCVFTGMIKRLSGYSESNPVSDLIRETWEVTGYMKALTSGGTADFRSRSENLNELITVAREHELSTGNASLSSFLEKVSLSSGEDDEAGPLEHVSLMTLHNAKGLEYKVVFIVGLEEGVFPHYYSLDDDLGIEEERRLFYVGMTRAQKLLYLIHANKRNLWGEEKTSRRSRFISEIPANYIYDISPSRAPSEVDISSGGKIKVGDRVNHRKWGLGRVIDVQHLNNTCYLTIRFPWVGDKKLKASVAPVKKVV